MSERLKVIENKKRLLVAVAHDDDPTNAGAIIKKVTDAGHRVDLVVMEDGSLGAKDGSRRATAQRREKELEAALGELGVSTYTELGIPDGRIDESRFRWAAKKGVTAAIRKHEPDAVITNSSEDYHMSHRYASEIAEWGVFHAGDVPLKIRENTFPWRHIAPTEKPVALYEMEPQGLKTRRSTTEAYDEENNTHLPGMLVVVTGAELEAELAFYDRFASQLETRTDGKKPYTEQRRDEARIRGRQTSSMYAEGLTQISYGGELTSTNNVLAEMFPREVKQIAA
jgi:LmbE family N-acetylglucosaminyl deacetylase